MYITFWKPNFGSHNFDKNSGSGQEMILHHLVYTGTLEHGRVYFDGSDKFPRKVNYRQLQTRAEV